MRKGEQAARPGQLFRHAMDGVSPEGVAQKLFKDVPFFIGHQLSDSSIRDWEDDEATFDRSLQWLIPGETTAFPHKQMMKC